MVNQSDKISQLLYSDENVQHSFTEIETWSEQYPQVAIFKTLLAKSKQLNGHPGYQSALKSAALYSSDRKKLYEFLVQPKIVAAINTIEAEAYDTDRTPDALTDDISTLQESIEQEVILKEGSSDITQPNSPDVNLKAEEEQARRVLEQEILQHAVSSSILLDAETDYVEERSENQAKVKEVPLEIENSNITQMESEDFEHLSVLDWLKLDSPSSEVNQFEKNQENAKDLIDQFIKKDPQRIGEEDKEPTRISIQKPKTEFFSPENMAKMSLMEDESLVTETLAKIYAQQGNVSKAKKTYEKLSLKFPEKRDYFARLIQELGNKQ